MFQTRIPPACQSWKIFFPEEKCKISLSLIIDVMTPTKPPWWPTEEQYQYLILFIVPGRSMFMLLILVPALTRWMRQPNQNKRDGTKHLPLFVICPVSPGLTLLSSGFLLWKCKISFMAKAVVLFISVSSPRNLSQSPSTSYYCLGLQTLLTPGPNTDNKGAWSSPASTQVVRINDRSRERGERSTIILMEILFVNICMSSDLESC